MRTVLVPLDGSVIAERALPVAAGIAKRTGARLELVAVHQPPEPGLEGALATDRRFEAEIRASLQRYIEETKQRVGATDEGPPTAALLLDGPAAETLAEHARRHPPDLVVLTTHGRGGPSRSWLGSVAESLVRRLTLPVLIVPSEGPRGAQVTSRGFGRVLVALDGTAESEAVVGPAATLAGAEAAEYTLLRVVSPLHPLLRAITSEGAYERDLREQLDLAEQYLDGVAQRLRADGLQVQTATRVDSRPAVGITELATEMDADLIALARHGRGPVGRLLLGSVADKVLRTAPAPVLLCRAPPDSERAAGGAQISAEAAAGRPVAAAPTLRRIAVALDFAEPSRRAAQWLSRHVGEAELVLMHAVSIPEPPAFLGHSLPARAELVENARRGAETRMHELGLALAPSRIWPEVRIGTPVDVITSLAAAYAPDLIVVGEHGQRTGASRLLGSTAERVLRGATAPVLLARDLPEGPPRRLLVAIDESALTDPVLGWARVLAERFDAGLVLLHVVSPVLSGAIASGGTESERRRGLAQLQADTRRWLDERAAAAGLAPGAVTTAVALGEPAPEILATATQSVADIIILGRHGRGRVGRALIGSTVERVLRLGDGPVLVVPEPS